VTGRPRKPILVDSAGDRRVVELLANSDSNQFAEGDPCPAIPDDGPPSIGVTVHAEGKAHRYRRLTRANSGRRPNQTRHWPATIQLEAVVVRRSSTDACRTRSPVTSTEEVNGAEIPPREASRCSIRGSGHAGPAGHGQSRCPIAPLRRVVAPPRSGFPGRRASRVRQLVPQQVREASPGNPDQQVISPAQRAESPADGSGCPKTLVGQSQT